MARFNIHDKPADTYYVLDTDEDTVEDVRERYPDIPTESAEQVTEAIEAFWYGLTLRAAGRSDQGTSWAADYLGLTADLMTEEDQPMQAGRRAALTAEFQDILADYMGPERSSDTEQIARLIAESVQRKLAEAWNEGRHDGLDAQTSLGVHPAENPYEEG